MLERPQLNELLSNYNLKDHKLINYFRKNHTLMNYIRKRLQWVITLRCMSSIHFEILDIYYFPFKLKQTLTKAYKYVHLMLYYSFDTYSVVIMMSSCSHIVCFIFYKSVSIALECELSILRSIHTSGEL